METTVPLMHAWSTVLVIAGASLRSVAFPNGLLFLLWGLLVANGFFDVDLSADWEMSQLLGLWGRDFILSWACAAVGVAVGNWGGVGDLIESLSGGNLSRLLEDLEVRGATWGWEDTGCIIAIAEGKTGWHQGPECAWAGRESSASVVVDANAFGLNKGIHVDLS